MIDRSGSEAGGIGAESQSGDPVAVVTQSPRRSGEQERVVDADGGVGRRRRDDVLGLEAPQDRTE